MVGSLDFLETELSSSISADCSWLWYFDSSLGFLSRWYLQQLSVFVGAVFISYLLYVSGDIPHAVHNDWKLCDHGCCCEKSDHGCLSIHWENRWKALQRGGRFFGLRFFWSTYLSRQLIIFYFGRHTCSRMPLWWFTSDMAFLPIQSTVTVHSPGVLLVCSCFECSTPNTSILVSVDNDIAHIWVESWFATEALPHAALFGVSTPFFWTFMFLKSLRSTLWFSLGILFAEKSAFFVSPVHYLLFSDHLTNSNQLLF